MYSDSLKNTITTGRCKIIVGWIDMSWRPGPCGRQNVSGSLAWSTLSYRCLPKGVRIISWPGSVNFERSPLAPLNQTPVRSGGPGGGASPVYHQAPCGFGLGG